MSITLTQHPGPTSLRVPALKTWGWATFEYASLLLLLPPVCLQVLARTCSTRSISLLDYCNTCHQLHDFQDLQNCASAV